MKTDGFTLIELMIVLAIMAIMASFAMPNLTGKIVSAQVSEGIEIGEYYQREIVEFYRKRGRFPHNNRELGIPAKGEILSNYVIGVSIDNGTINIEYGNYINKLAENKILSLQPLVVPGSPSSPIDWSCGLRKAPQGMRAIGSNNTTLPVQFLPLNCR